MLRESALRWSWMNILNRKRLDSLKSAFKSIDQALDQISLEILQELGCREDTAMLALNRLEEFSPESYENELQKRDISFCSFDDDEYPQSLKEIPDNPIFLYYRGDLSILQQPCLAIVGTREMSDYGKRVVAEVVPPIVQAGIITVSGLAYGIDAEVAKETMHVDGKTVAVLGHGLGMMYPSAHEKLGQEIIRKGGLILSEFPLDTRPDKFTFPARNRIIAGLSLGTVVIEAAKESGSLITAELALEYGKEVFAIPGSIFDEHYAGCHHLISSGTAKLVRSAEEILVDLGVVSSARDPEESSYVPESQEEEMILKVLSSMPISIDDLAAKTALEIAMLNGVLTILELRGVVRNVGAGMWVR